MSPTRRQVLQLGYLSIVPALAGCSSDGTASDTPTGTATETPTPEPTDTLEPTPSPEPTAEDRLPEPRNGWRLLGTEGMDWRMIGGEWGVIGNYESPDGTLFNVVVMKTLEEYSAEDDAERWACIGWDVAVAYRGYAFAAGTGTTQETLTPEQPPHMTRTPVPGSEERSRELLTYSPLLDEQTIAENRQYC